MTRVFLLASRPVRPLFAIGLALAALPSCVPANETTQAPASTNVVASPYESKPPINLDLAEQSCKQQNQTQVSACVKTQCTQSPNAPNYEVCLRFSERLSKSETEKARHTDTVRNQRPRAKQRQKSQVDHAQKQHFEAQQQHQRDLAHLRMGFQVDGSIAPVVPESKRITQDLSQFRPISSYTPADQIAVACETYRTNCKLVKYDGRNSKINPPYLAPTALLGHSQLVMGMHCFFLDEGIIIWKLDDGSALMGKFHNPDSFFVENGQPRTVLLGYAIQHRQDEPLLPECDEVNKRNQADAVEVNEEPIK